MQTTKVVIGGKSVNDLLLYIIRCRGAIVIVSSGACSQITPLMTVYAGTKVKPFYIKAGTQYTQTGNLHTGKCICWKYIVKAELSKLTYV